MFVTDVKCSQATRQIIPNSRTAAAPKLLSPKCGLIVCIILSNCPWAASFMDSCLTGSLPFFSKIKLIDTSLHVFKNKLDHHWSVNWGLNKFFNKNSKPCLATRGIGSWWHLVNLVNLAAILKSLHVYALLQTRTPS